MPSLSILICTLDRRKEYLDRLIRCLSAQTTSEVEIITDHHPTDSIGTKRDRLLSKATGEYCVFIDDDDLVAPNYIPLILKAIESKPDVVDINLIMTTDGIRAERSFHMLSIKEWSEKEDLNIAGHKFYLRYPNHLNPVKTEIAKKVGFIPISEGEDKDYSKRLQPYLRNSVYIHQPIYFYLHTSTPL